MHRAENFCWLDNIHLSVGERCLWVSPYFSNSANIPAQAKSLPHSLEQAVRGIGLYMKTNKTKFIYGYNN